MMERDEASLAARAHFEDLWKRGDPWDTDTSEFEQAKFKQEFQLLAGRRYRRALEIGCGAGSFTRLLATIADEVVAIDIAESAIERARQVSRSDNVDFRVADIMQWDPESEGSWDLITLADTISLVGSAYSFVDIACLAASLFVATEPDGRLLAANIFGGTPNSLFRPWVIRTYHDLLSNVGYRLEAEAIFHGVKETVEIPVLISLFHKSRHDAKTREEALW
jgi:SAM-dependent methyltransferase